LLTIESYALKGISLAIEAGQMVAFCGRTGSGKSSIMSLIFRLYAPSRGEIALNAETSLDLLSWRKCISVIPQSGFVFKGTILDNLVPQHEAWKLERLNEYLAHIPIELDLN
jgi:ATP-binding cassette subfamily C (CFTR/MRP) protein 10